MILVTGGTGLLGLNIVRQLATAGERVRVLVRPSAQPRLGLEDIEVEQAPGDVTDAESVRRAMQGVRQVYHVAALTWQGPWQSVRRQMEAVNVGGTEIVARAALEAGVERLVHTSSTVAIGHGTLEQPATEESAWNFEGFGPYYDTKHEAEAVIHRFIGEGLDAVIVNPGYMLGPWDIKPTSGTMLLEAARTPFGIPFYTGGGNNLCDVEDVAEGHRLAMEKGVAGRRYILANENLPYREIFTLVNRAVGKPPPRLRMPKTLLLGVAPLLDAVGYFMPERMDKYNSSTVRAGETGLYVSPERAVRELGLKSTPVEQSLEKAVRWFRDHGYLG